VNPSPPKARPRLREPQVVAVAARHLESSGYRVYVDVDGTDYFDLVARKGTEVGLVEAKVGDRKSVLAQALKRRVWGSWSAVVLASRISAERLAAATAAGRAAPLGVWTVEGDRVQVVRPARDWVAPGGDDPYRALRERFLLVLDQVDRGELPAGIPWDGLPGEIRRASGGRGFAEWRLDEPAAESD